MVELAIAFQGFAAGYCLFTAIGGLRDGRGMAACLFGGLACANAALVLACIAGTLP